jgi:hypothetical protein
MHHDSNLRALCKDALVCHGDGLGIESANENIAKLSRTAYGNGILLARNSKLLAVGDLSSAESAQENTDTSDEAATSSGRERVDLYVITLYIAIGRRIGIFYNYLNSLHYNH